jgi:hypothetical protein
MSRVIIVVDASVGVTGLAGALPTTVQMVEAIKDTIASSSSTTLTVEVITSTDLAQNPLPSHGEIIWCPLTLELPDTLQFWGQNIFQACRNLTKLRQQIEQFGYKVGDTQETKILYLPIVLTAKGPLYGEVIGQAETTEYQQPIDLPDNQRQPLYHLAYQLLQALSAPPSVYLLQFGYEGEEIIADCLLPFPDTPALASIGVQEPNLCTCYWHCLTNRPILDLTILPKSAQEIVFRPKTTIDSL